VRDGELVEAVFLAESVEQAAVDDMHRGLPTATDGVEVKDDTGCATIEIAAKSINAVLYDDAMPLRCFIFTQ
jgi:hypothetical protein